MFWEKIFGGGDAEPVRKSYLAFDASKTETDRISAEQLSSIASSVEEHLRAVEGIIRKSGDDAAEFSSSLEQESAALADPETAAENLAKLVALTREMVEKTRKVEGELRARSEAVGLLQGNLQQEKARADTDRLTGLTNRRAFERELGSAAERARIYNTPLSIAFCDVDNFKVINDIHGPATGDRVLTFIGTVLDDCIDKRGKVSRHDGAEFVILFEGKTARQARDLTEQARKELSERRIVDRQSGRPVGYVDFSAGVSAIGPDYDIGVMLSKADQALFKAKQAGRGTVKMVG
jgi:diguanylate cyclase